MKLVALLVVTVAMGWAAECEQKITVYLRGSSIVPNSVWSQARLTAAKIFSAANVRIDWRTGDQLPLEKAIVVSMVAHAPVDSLRGALAFTRPYERVHITVFWDRIEHPVRPASKGMILAHVLVHEITHILQGIERHSETGIMKAAWANHDFRDMAWKPLAFTPHDIVLIRLGRKEFATGCPDSTTPPAIRQRRSSDGHATESSLGGRPPANKVRALRRRGFFALLHCCGIRAGQDHGTEPARQAARSSTRIPAKPSGTFSKIRRTKGLQLMERRT